ncbi:MAG TPA: pitrilysin family protein [Polyangia bacterium]|nr:pitrilysin family protein [Polyangia bacterium]
MTMSINSALVALAFALPGFACAASRGRSGPGASPTRAPASRAGDAAAGTAAAELVEVASASLGALTARKWRLGNGLEVVLLPDPQATNVSYTTWFRVGSRNENERAGETGLAHLFEHLMFTQTKTMAADEFDRAIEAAGGNANAMTYYDFTAYVTDLPPQELALAARLEADRMTNLDLRKRQVETERDVVVEERLSAVEDSVDGTMDEVLFKQAFKTHPYRWPVIGWMKDIKAVTQEKALAFYRRFYAPNNAVLVIAGDIDPAAMLDLIARHYGGIPAAEPPPPDRAQPERAPAGEVRTTLTRPVPADRLVIGFPAPGLADRDRAAYEVVTELLAGGPSSRLNRTLVVDKQWASSVRGDVIPTRDPGLFSVWVQMTKGHAAEQAERVISDATTALATQPTTNAELGRAIARLETAFWQRLASSHGRAEALGEFETAGGGFQNLFTRAAAYQAVTVEDVKRIAAQYLATEARSIVIVRPKNETRS